MILFLPVCPARADAPVFRIFYFRIRGWSAGKIQSLAFLPGNNVLPRHMHRDHHAHTVIAPKSHLLHQLRGRVAQVFRYPPRFVLADKRAGFIIRKISSIALGNAGKIQGSLRQGQFTLGTAQPFVSLGSIQRDTQGARVGQSDIFDRHANQAPRDVQSILP